MIRQLPAGHALVIRGGHTPVIARLGAAWKDPAYRRARRRGAAVARLTPAAARTSRKPWRHRTRHAPPGQAAAGRPRPRRRGSGRGPRRRLPGLPVELTMPGEPEGLTAVLLQLAGITQKLAELDQRHAGDTRELKERIAALASTVSELKGTTASHAETLAALDGLDRRSPNWPPRPPATSPVTATATGRPTSPRRHRSSGSPAARPATRRSPGSAPGSSRCTGPATATSRPAWATAGSSTRCACTSWTGCPSCGRSCTSPRPAPPGTLAGQAEWHTRLLAAAAEQLARETRGCRPRHQPPPHRARPGARP